MSTFDEFLKAAASGPEHAEQAEPADPWAAFPDASPVTPAGPQAAPSATPSSLADVLPALACTELLKDPNARDAVCGESDGLISPLLIIILGAVIAGALARLIVTTIRGKSARQAIDGYAFSERLNSLLQSRGSRIVVVFAAAWIFVSGSALVIVVSHDLAAAIAMVVLPAIGIILAGASLAWIRAAGASK